MAVYTLADAKGELVRHVLDIVGEAAREREAAAETGLGREAPGNIWDLGTWMWEPGTKHLPATWVNEVCPKDLALKDAPTLNVYRALVEQIQGGVLSAMPDLEFDAENAGIANILNDAWRDTTEKSRLLAELDLCVAHNCNYGAGWLGIHRNSAGEPYIRAVHPQLVVCDPAAERPQDLMWVAKLFVENTGTRNDGETVLDEARWPESILPKPECSEIRMELWIRRGATFAGRSFKETGLRAVIRSGGRIVEEEDWPHDVLPIVPVYLLPSDRMVGHSLAAVLWQAQVRVDKILGVMLSRTARSAGEKYRIARDVNAAAPGEGLTCRAEQDLKKPGVQVITSDSPIEMYAPPPVPADLVALLREAIADMERLAGISQPYQGVAPKGVTAGVAITALAGMSSRRVNRMAAHLAEALRDFGKAWAKFELTRRGIETTGDLRVKVSLEVQEEETRRKQFDAALELARAGINIPEEVLIDLIPGLSTAKKNDIRVYIRKGAEAVPDAGEDEVEKLLGYLPEEKATRKDQTVGEAVPPQASAAM